MKIALVCGAGGFIGSHLVKRLKREGYWVRGVDLKLPEFWETEADDFVVADLRDAGNCAGLLDRRFDEVYQLAADMGGAGYVFVGENDAQIMHNSAMVNLNVLEACKNSNSKRLFYSSSACIYPQDTQQRNIDPELLEETAYPGNPDSEYGWEKLFSERLYFAYQKNYGLEVRVARYHNIFGPYGSWCDGREKVPAAICRKVAEADSGSSIEIWGDGEQTRSFMYVDECLEATTRLTRSDWSGPVNIGSNEMVSINQLAHMTMTVAGKKLTIKHVPGPLGVRGRNSHNELYEKMLGWKPGQLLIKGLEKTYPWIMAMVNKG